MHTTEKIKDLFLLGYRDTPEKKLEQKVLMLNLIGVVFFFSTLVFSLFLFARAYPLLGIVLLTALILYAGNYLFFRLSGRYRVYSLGFILIVSLQFAMIIMLNQPGTESAMIWLFFIPPLAFFFLNRREAFAISSLMFLLAWGLFLVPWHPVDIIHFTRSFKIHFSIVYIVLLLIILGFDTIQQSIIRSSTRSKEEAMAANKAKEDFIARLSHQIRTPLNDIFVLGDLLGSSHLDDKQKDLIQTIIASTNNLVNVVNSITQDSGIEVTYMKRDDVRFELPTTITSLLDLISRNISEGIEITPPPLNNMTQYLMGDPILLKQILLNIFDSIIKSYKGSALKVDFSILNQRESDSEIELRFDIGVSSPIAIPEIAATDVEVTGDSGIEPEAPEEAVELDISIARKLIGMKNGGISLQRAPDRSVISFILIYQKAPYTGEVPVKKEKVISIEKLRRAPKADLKNSNILLVEDNLINQKIVVLSLAKLVRNVDLASDGKEALDEFGTTKYDLILMDIQMPVMNGIIATKKIREIEASTNSHTPIIAITANAMLGDRETCLSAGMDEYISKPFLLEDLVQKMKDLLT